MKNPVQYSDGSRRQLLMAGAGAVAAAMPAVVQAQSSLGKPVVQTAGDVVGQAHWAIKKVPGHDVRLFMWNKRLAQSASTPKATVLLVHGSSVSSTPVYDLSVPGRDDASLMDWLARRGFDV